MSVTVRDACIGDLDTIVSYNCAMALETEALVLPPDVARRGVEAVLNAQAAARYFVGEVDGSVQTQLMVTYEWSDWRACNIWWVQSVYVTPAHRRQGLFRQMYQHVRAKAVESGACGIRLYTELNNTKAQASVYEDLTTPY